MSVANRPKLPNCDRGLQKPCDETRNPGHGRGTGGEKKPGGSRRAERETAPGSLEDRALLLGTLGFHGDGEASFGRDRRLLRRDLQVSGASVCLRGGGRRG